MDIAFAISDSYSQHCCVAMASILKNNPGSGFRFHILSDYISGQNRIKLGALSGGSSKYELIFHTISQKTFETFQINLAHTTLHTYYRYIIADILPETDKCLYLDADIVVNGPVEELWNTGLGDNYCAGVEDVNVSMEYKQRLETSEYPYINAGMLLLNLRKIRQDGMAEELFEVTPNILNRMNFQDQDAINYVFRGHILILPSKWNFTKEDSLRTPELCSEAVVIHYTEDRKPWLPHYYSRHSMRRLYFKYLKLTPYSSFGAGFRVKRALHRITKPFEPIFKPGKKQRTR